MAAATEPEVRTRLGSDEIASLAVGSDETDGWEKVLTAHSSRDQGISLGFGDEEEEDREILEEKRDTADLRHIVVSKGFGQPESVGVEGARRRIRVHQMSKRLICFSDISSHGGYSLPQRDGNEGANCNILHCLGLFEYYHRIKGFVL